MQLPVASVKCLVWRSGWLEGRGGSGYVVGGRVSRHLAGGGLQLQSMSPLAPLLVMLVTRQLLHHRIFTLLDCTVSFGPKNYWIKHLMKDNLLGSKFEPRLSYSIALPHTARSQSAIRLQCTSVQLRGKYVTSTGSTVLTLQIYSSGR